MFTKNIRTIYFFDYLLFQEDYTFIFYNIYKFKEEQEERYYVETSLRSLRSLGVPAAITFQIRSSFRMKPLRLIHISKTGGQAISQVAGEQANIRWGMYDEEYGIGRMCHRLLSNIRKKEIIDRHDWFMVVRNPYDRMISQYNWHVTWRKEEIDVNEYLDRELSQIDSEFNQKGCHFTQQYRYLEPQYNIRVLRFENLEEEFNSLMKEYGYSIVLNKKVNVSNKFALLADLTPDTIRLINRIYEKDFTTFGYDMIH